MSDIDRDGNRPIADARRRRVARIVIAAFVGFGCAVGWLSAYTIAWGAAVSGVAAFPVLGGFLVPIAILATASAGMVLTLWIVWRTARFFWRRSDTAIAVVAVSGALLLPVCVHPVNWAVWHPASNFYAHIGGFAVLAEHIDNGDYRDIGVDEYYGRRLPAHLASLSVNGKITVTGSCNGRPVYFVPQWIGVPDDAGGYLYIHGRPHPDESCFADMFGRLPRITDARRLAGGWWWL